MTDSYTELCRENGVILYEYQPEHGGRWLGVADDGFSHYRVTFRWSEDGTVSVGVDAEWSDKEPGKLANFTHEVFAYCGPNDSLAIDDDGLLTVLARRSAASTVDFRSGFTLQLPSAFIAVVRKAIRLARARALAATGAISHERLRELEAAE